MKAPDESSSATAVVAPPAPTSEAIEIWDTAKVLVSDLNTRQPTDKDPNVIDLIEAIRIKGQLTPGIARPHPKKKGHLELAAGACRRTACHALGIQFKVVVREMSDQEFEDVIFMENDQRADPDPRQEALYLERRIARGETPSDIAARLGKPESWLKRRMKLLGLTAIARDEWAPGKKLEHFNVEMMEFVGSLEPDAQDELVTGYYAGEITSMKGLRECVFDRAADLSKVKWLDDPESFVDGCGPGCAHNTADGLFPDPANPCGECTNTECFSKRLNQLRDARTDKILDGRKLGDFIVYRTDYGQSFVYQGKEVKTLASWEFERHFTVVKKDQKDEKDSVLGLNVTDPIAIKVTILKVKAEGNGSSAGTKTPGKKEPRENAVIAKRLVILNKLLVEKLKSASQPAKPPVLVLVAAFGTMSRRADGMATRSKDWNAVDDGKSARVLGEHMNEKTVPVEEALWASVRMVLTNRLSFFKNGDLLSKDKQEEMKRTAALIGVDYDKEYARIATTEVKPPKSWGPDIDPITLKKVSAKEKLAAAAAANSTSTPVKKSAECAKPSTKSPKKVAKKAAKKAPAKADKKTSKSAKK